MKRIGIILCCMLATSAHASGWGNQNYSASTLGLSNAVVASADDVAAAAYNPAGIAWQDGVQVMGGVDYHYRNSSVVLGDNIAPNTTPDNNLNYLYASWIQPDNPWGVSMAYNTPFDVNNQWDEAFPTTSGSTVIRAERLSMDAIYAMNSSMAFSMGADWYRTLITLTQDGNSFQGKDNASLGVHAGLKWKFVPQWMLGASIRKGSNISVNGSDSTTVTLNLPDEFQIGVAHDLDDAFRIEMDVNWVRWAQMQDVNVTSGNTIIQPNVFNLKDALAIKTGVTWFWRENTQFRFGYAYDTGANQSVGFHPMIADQPSNRVSIGMGGDFMGVHFDLAYAYTFYVNQTAMGEFSGTYRDRHQSLALSISKGI